MSATGRATDPQKALVEVLEPTGEPREPREQVPVSFYPTEYQVRSGARYTDDPQPGRASPATQFLGGDSETLVMDLLFDTYEDGGDVRRTYLDRFDSLLRPDPDGGAPPLCRVSWGSLDFTGVLVSTDRRFTLFARDGTPLRARVTVEFRAADPVEPADVEPVTVSEQPRTHVVVSGDTLWAIAGAEYGDPTEWRTIADANDVEDPRQLQVGTVLEIPPRGDR